MSNTHRAAGTALLPPVSYGGNSTMAIHTLSIDLETFSDEVGAGCPVS